MVSFTLAGTVSPRVPCGVLCLAHLSPALAGCGYPSFVLRFCVSVSTCPFLDPGKRKKNWTGCTRVPGGWWTVTSTCWGAPSTNTFLRRWRRRRQAALRRQDSSQALSLPHRVPIPSSTWPARSGRTRSSSSGAGGAGRAVTGMLSRRVTERLASQVVSLSLFTSCESVCLPLGCLMLGRRLHCGCLV